LVRCSTTYDSTLNRPDSVSAGPARRDDGQPERTLQEERFHRGQRPQGCDLPAHVGINRSQSIEQGLPCHFPIALDVHTRAADRRL
jgi:hypothetical protein